jgi:hypothetical protein
MATDNKPTPKKQATEKVDDEIVIPFISDDDIASGQEERIKLFARIMASKQAVPKAWLVTELGISSGSLSSLTSRYGYSIKTVTTVDGVKACKLTVKKDKKNRK